MARAAEDDLSERPPATPSVLRRTLSAGRVGTYTLLGAGAGVVPVPWVPGVIGRRIRGAMVHDIATRHGLSLTLGARRILCETSPVEGGRGFLAQGVTFAATKLLGRFGPLGMLQPVRSALATYLLGHLFQRYLETARTDRAVRVDTEEARRVRRAIDQSLVYALTIEAHHPPDEAPFTPEDFRDQPTQIVDGILIGLAGLPAWSVHRVEAAFDEVLSNIRA